MRTWLCGLAVVAALTNPVAAQDKAAVAVVRKAIDAHGGAELLNKYPAGTFEMKGELSMMGLDIPFTGTGAYSVPGKFKLDMVASLMGQKLPISQVVNGDKVKNAVGGMASPLTDAQKDELKQAPLMQEIGMLTPLLDAAKFTLAAEKDGEADGKPAAVVLVKRKDMKDVRLFFDKASGLLVKTARQSLDPSDAEVREETLMSDYQKVSGIQVPMKSVVTHDGKKYLTMTFSEYKPLEKLDAKEFTVAD